MRERLLTNFVLAEKSSAAIVLQNPQGYVLAIEVVDAGRDMLRVRLTGKDRPLPFNTFFKTYHDGKDGARAGIELQSLQNTDNTASMQLGRTTATLDWSSSPCLTITDTKTGDVLHRDLPYRGYNLTAHGIRHYSCLNRKGDIHLGLGEVAAPMDLTNRRFEVRTSDSASYDSWGTDPLYKHTPYLVRVPRNKPDQLCTAYFSSSHADSVWDVGYSIDEPWGAYKSFEVETGALDTYIFCGNVQELTDTLASLTTAEPIMPPRWALGYISSPMGLAALDHPPAQVQLERFLEQLQENDIPTSGIHFSSSYTVTKGSDDRLARNVFTLNTYRFPDLSGFCKTSHKLGIRVVPNIKPYINKFHPGFTKLEKGGLFHDPDTGKHVKTWIWSLNIGEKLEGGWIDTSSAVGFDWWYQGASRLIQQGVDGLWNDNDEYSLHDDGYEAGWEIEGLPGQNGQRKKVGLVGRTTFTELLGKSSHKALADNSPGRRPYILTRSANINTMQYCCSTWSGDNQSDWKAFKGNFIMALNASMSLYFSYGADVGGFAGPLPSAELFTRWCQAAAYHTRFCINSIHLNPNDPDQFSVNSPWQHQEALPRVRDVIKRRYEMVPYVYNLHHQARQQKIPPVAFTGWGEYRSDQNLFDNAYMDEGDFWLGVGKILVAPIYAPALKTRQVYLPKAYADDKTLYFALFGEGSSYSAGTTVDVSTSIDSIPVFARAGTIIPIGKPCATITCDLGKTTNDGTLIAIKPGFVEMDDWRGVEIFPPREASEEFTGEWIEDDGESTWPAPIACVRVTYSSKGKNEVAVKAAFVESAFKPFWQTLWVILPRGDGRTVTDAVGISQRKDGRTSYEINISTL